MKRALQWIASLALVAGAVGVAVLLWVTRPVAVKVEEEVAPTVVEVLPVEFGTHRFELPSQGLIEAKRRATLAAEVAGRVVAVSPAFETGTEVPEGEWLIRLDPVDYETAVAQAASQLAEADAALASEEARAEQALRDWRNLGRSGDPPDLVARRPQLESARSRSAAAAASLAKAEADLRRTEVRSPFDAVVAAKHTEVGDFLQPGRAVAEVFAATPYEVRLPLSADESAYLETDTEGRFRGEVELRTVAAGETRRWPARIVREEGEIDRATRSLYLVAEVANEPGAGPIAIRPGLFMDAAIRSRPVEGVAKLPFRAFRLHGSQTHLVVVDSTNRIRFREMDVVFRRGDDFYVSGDLRPGDRACLTEIPDLIEGVEVSPVELPDESAAAPLQTRSGFE